MSAVKKKISKKEKAVKKPITSEFLQNLHKDLCYGIFDVDANIELSDESDEDNKEKISHSKNKFSFKKYLILGITIVSAICALLFVSHFL